MRSNNFHVSLALSIISLVVIACGKMDYQDREYYKQEVYIISSLSTSAVEREVSNLLMCTYTDTLRILNDDYELDTLRDNTPKECKVLFKIGIGGSQPAQEDIEVIVGFDEEELEDYNIVNHTECRIPAQEDYSTNVAYSESKGGFPVIIPQGGSSSKLEFTFRFQRDDLNKPNADEANYAIPLVIKSATGGVGISRQYNKFMVSRLIANVNRITDWSGYPIPSIPPGRYHSVRLQGNPGENTVAGTHYVWKYVLPLEDPATPDEQKDPSLAGKYMIFGTGVWSFSVFGYHYDGWMYKLLELNDEAAGTYTLSPILPGNNDFPARTFAYATVQEVTEDSHYDPKLKQLTVHYKNVINSEYNDVLTYVGEPVLDVAPTYVHSEIMPYSWGDVKARGYKYWVPQN